MKNRNINIDIIKGIGIILMVGGHCGMPFTHFIYLFHMAIFFMASGYCFNASNSETMQDVLSFVKRKFKGLWFPYVLWTAVFVAVPLIYAGLQSGGDPEHREHLANILAILQRGMAAKSKREENE